MTDSQEDSNFPSAMNFQDLLDLSNSIPEECASVLPTVNAHNSLAQDRHGCFPERMINYEEPLLNKIESLYESRALSDVTFFVGEERREFKAHKMILALTSPVFTAMFYGDLANQRQSPQQEQSESGTGSSDLNTFMTTVEVPDCTPNSFENLLQFIYKGDEPTLNVDEALSLLYTSRKYSVRGLEDKCCVVLSSSITAENVFDILYAATFYNLPALDYQCWEFLEDNPVEVMGSHLEFMTHETMQAVLRNDKLNADEVEIFKVLMRWATSECSKNGLEPTPENLRSMCSEELKLIRFPTMTGAEFADIVVPTQVLTVDQVAKIFTIINTSDEKKEAMNELLNSEFTDKKRAPKEQGESSSNAAARARAIYDKTMSPVFTFVSPRVRERELANLNVNLNPPGASIRRIDDRDLVAAIAAVVVNPESNVNVVLNGMPNAVPSTISQQGERGRSRQRQTRRNRRRGTGSNDANPPPQQHQQPPL